jgi:hypothetical protein
VSAVLVGRDGSRRALPIGPDIFDNEHAEMDVFWESSGSCSNDSGVNWAYVWLDNPYE